MFTETAVKMTVTTPDGKTVTLGYGDRGQAQRNKNDMERRGYICGPIERVNIVGGHWR